MSIALNDEEGLSSFLGAAQYFRVGQRRAPIRIRRHQWLPTGQESRWQVIPAEYSPELARTHGGTCKQKSAVRTFDENPCANPDGIHNSLAEVAGQLSTADPAERSVSRAARQRRRRNTRTSHLHHASLPVGSWKWRPRNVPALGPDRLSCANVVGIERAMRCSGPKSIEKSRAS